jgi:hypothetical protein
MNITITRDELLMIRLALARESNGQNRRRMQNAATDAVVSLDARDKCAALDDLLDKLPTPVDEIVLGDVDTVAMDPGAIFDAMMSGDPHEAAALTEEYLIEKSDR